MLSLTSPAELLEEGKFVIAFNGVLSASSPTVVPAAGSCGVDFVGCFGHLCIGKTQGFVNVSLGGFWVVSIFCFGHHCQGLLLYFCYHLLSRGSCLWHPVAIFCSGTIDLTVHNGRQDATGAEKRWRRVASQGCNMMQRM